MIWNPWRRIRELEGVLEAAKGRYATAEARVREAESRKIRVPSQPPRPFIVRQIIQYLGPVVLDGPSGYGRWEGEGPMDGDDFVIRRILPLEVPHATTLFVGRDTVIDLSAFLPDDPRKPLATAAVWPREAPRLPVGEFTRACGKPDPFQLSHYINGSRFVFFVDAAIARKVP